MQNYYNRGAERSISELDQPHNLIVNGVAELPFGREKHFLSNNPAVLDKFVGGWKVTSIFTEQSGFPLTLSAAGTGASTRPNLVPGVDPRIQGSRSNQQRVLAYFNKAAFVTPPAYTGLGRIIVTFPFRGFALDSKAFQSDSGKIVRSWEVDVKLVGLAGWVGIGWLVLGGVAPAGLVDQAAPARTAAQAPASPADELTKARVTLADWAQLGRYRAENAALPAVKAEERRVVFYGDSITDAWGRRPDTGVFFPGKSYINRGISGQTTPQMLVRFEQDVVRLKPAAVVILAGTNDVAGNTGPSTPEMTEDNFRAMAAIAKAAGIRVVLASILPASAYPWKPSLQPAETIREINAWMKDFCANEGLVYLDYYSALADDKGGMREGTSKDGVHPNAKGYAVMGPLAEKTLSATLGR